MAIIQPGLLLKHCVTFSHLCNDSKNILLLPRNAKEISLVFHYVPMSKYLFCFQERMENGRPQTAKNITYLENLLLSDQEEIRNKLLVPIGANPSVLP